MNYRKLTVPILCFLVTSGIISLFFVNDVVQSVSLGRTSDTEISKRKQSLTYTVHPERHQTLSQIVVSFSPRDLNLEHHHDLLEKIPSYTETIILVPEKNLDVIKEKIDARYSGNFRYVTYNSQVRNDVNYYMLFPEHPKLVKIEAAGDRIENGLGSIWARDLFYAARGTSGKPFLLVPDIHKYFISYGDITEDKVINDNYYLKNLASQGISLLKTPLTFQGGNVQVDEFKNEKIVFVGSNTLRSTSTVWRSTTEREPSEREIIKELKGYFNVDRVVILVENQVQPPSLLFHLDQTMIILDEGVIGLTHIVGRDRYVNLFSEEVREVDVFLSMTRDILINEGYKVLDIQTSVKNVLNREYYVNSIPFTDKKSGRKKIFMPVFEQAETGFDEELIKQNTKTFKSVGYEVIHVTTKANTLNGGIHCLVNVLN